MSDLVIISNRQDVVIPSGAVGTPGAKGDPGGNIMAIGLFTAASGITIPGGTNIVRTSGYSADGVGVADYVYDAAIDSAYVTANPRTSFRDAGGRGFRLSLSQQLTVQMAGGKNDCTAIGAGTDNAPAINALVAYGAAQGKSVRIIFPKGALGYRVASGIVFQYGVKLSGEGWHENPGNVGGTSYSPPQHLRGSILVFDANVAGLQFIDYTDNLANATAFEFEGSRYSVVEDLLLWGGGGTSTSAHGVETRTVVDFRNVRIENFAGNGLLITADTSGALPYGNASSSKFSHCFFLANGMHGARVKGTDASAITFLGCNFSNNGGAGYFDDTHVGGNNLISCHFATNNKSNGAGTAQTTAVQADSSLLATAANGSIILSNAAATPHVLFGCYIEGGAGSKAHAPAGTLVLGGILGQIGSAVFEATSAPTILDGAGALQATDVQSSGSLTIHHGSGGHISVQNDAGGTAILQTKPGSGTFSDLQLLGNSNSLANGLDILAGGGAGYISADSLVIRNAAQSVTYGTWQSSGLNLGSGKTLQVNGTQVLTSRRTGWTAPTGTATRSGFATGSATLQNVAEALKALIDDLTTHGVIGA